MHFRTHAAATLLLIACGARAGERSAEPGRESEAVCLEPVAEGCALHQVPLAELLARPSQWRGRRVAVEGYLHLESEGGALYASAEDYERGSRRAALLTANFLQGVLEPSCDCTDRDVVVVGMYDPSDKGQGGTWGGAVKDIEKVQVRPN